jgi:DivIVA domain-containing protein
VPFSPQEIENKEFVLSFRGYDRREVRAFLRAAALDYGAALDAGQQAALTELESRARSLTGLVSAVEDAKRNFALARRRAEVDARAIRESAESDARQILADAERQANDTKEAADRALRERLEQVMSKTEELRALEARMKRSLYFLETALDLTRRDLSLEAIAPSRSEDAPDLPVSAAPYLGAKPGHPA